MRALLKQSLIIYLMFDQTIWPMRQTLNVTFYFRMKYIPDTSIDGKSKVKEILKDESDELNNFSRRYILKTEIQTKISLNVQIWVENEALILLEVQINRHFRGGSYRIDQKLECISCSQGNLNNVAVSPMFSTVFLPIKVLSQEGFPNVHP